MLALARSSRPLRPSTSYPSPSQLASSVTSPPSAIVIGRRHLGQIPQGLVGGSRDQAMLEYEDPEPVVRRAERKSPAAAFGSKKMPSICLPSELENKMERLFGGQDVKLTRAAYKLFLNEPRGYGHIRAPAERRHTGKADLRPVPIKRTPRHDIGKSLDLDSQPLKLMPAQTNKELVFAHASGQMPAQYAIMRNIMRELQSRSGWNTEENKGDLQFMDFAAGYGAGAWASIATFPSPEGKRNSYVQIEANRTVAELSQHLLEPGTPGPVNNWGHSYYRSVVKFNDSRPNWLKARKSVAVCGFHLSTMKAPVDRRRVVRAMWNSGAEYIVIAEQAFKDSFDVVAEARAYLLELAERERNFVSPLVPAAKEEPVEEEEAEEVKPRTRGRKTSWRNPSTQLPRDFVADLKEADPESDRLSKPGSDGKERFTVNGIEFEETDFEPVQVAKPADLGVVEREKIPGCYIVAPCPHDLACPMASTPDTCHFTQRLEQPAFSRMTKNTKKGIEELKMSYIIVRRGDRPVVLPEERGEGRIGEVGRELLEKERDKQSTHVEMDEDGVYTSPDIDGEEPEPVTLPEVDMDKLRKEAQEWGRIIYPPIIKKDLITVDRCMPSGQIERGTYPRSLGRQVWYDLKSAQWSDLVPHKAKSSVPRLRGIKKLTPAHKKNKIVISDGKITGLDNLSRVEYEDVIQLFTSLGVPLPERPQRSRKFIDWRKELRFSDGPTGWLSKEGWGIGDQIYGHDGSKDRKAGVDKLVAEAGGVGSLMHEKRVRRKQPDAEWTSDGGWIPKDEKRPAELDEEEVKEWEPTRLLGEMEIDPDGYQPKFPLKGMDQYDFSGLEEEGQEEEGPDDYDRHIAAAADEINNANIAAHNNNNNAQAGPSTRREPPPPGYPDMQPPALFSAEDLDKMTDVSFAAPVRMDLAGLGPGWLEETELGSFVSASQRKVSARDRMNTFKKLGIKVPDLGRPRTAADDWALLEAWDGEEGSKDKGWRTERLTSDRRTGRQAGGRGRSGGRS